MDNLFLSDTKMDFFAVRNVLSWHGVGWNYVYIAEGIPVLT